MADLTEGLQGMLWEDVFKTIIARHLVADHGLTEEEAAERVGLDRGE